MEVAKEPRDRTGSVSGPSSIFEQRERSGSTTSQKRRRADDTSDEEMDIEQEEMPVTVDQRREGRGRSRGWASINSGTQ